MADNLTMWTYSNKEISDLELEFEKVFNVNLFRDYENVWEWIWSLDYDLCLDRCCHNL